MPQGPINDFPINNIPVNNFQQYPPVNDFQPYPPFNNNNFRPFPPVNDFPIPFNNFQPYFPVNDFPTNNIPANNIPVRKPVSPTPMKQTNKVMAPKVMPPKVTPPKVTPPKVMAREVEFDDLVAREVPFVSKIPVTNFNMPQPPVFQPFMATMGHGPVVHYGTKVAREVKLHPVEGVSKIPLKPINHIPVFNNDIPRPMPYFNDPKVFRGVSKIPVRPGDHVPTNVLNNDSPPPVPYYNNPRVFSGSQSPFRQGPGEPKTMLQQIGRDVESDDLVAREVKPFSGISKIPVYENHIPIFHNNLPVPPISSFNLPEGPRPFGPRLPEGPHPFGRILTNIGRELQDDLMERDVESENLVAREVKPLMGVSKIPVYDHGLPALHPVNFNDINLLPKSHGPVREPVRPFDINKTPVRPFENVNKIPISPMMAREMGDDLMERDYDDFLYE